MSALVDRVLSLRQSSQYEWIEKVILRNPLNAILAIIAIYLFISLLLPYSTDKLTPLIDIFPSSSSHHNGSYSYLPEHPPVMLWKKYTPRTLAIYDGSDFEIQGGRKSKRSKEEPKILLAISGKVFDVTKGGHFYGPGGPYGNFAGRDASRGMAKQSFDLDTLTPLDRPIDTLEDLTPMEISNMREWEAHFTSKYGIVGELVNEGEEL